jgi:hypothetical protein
MITDPARDRPAFETKIATLANVREWTEGEPVEVWLNRRGRIVIRAFNECGNNSTDVDLFDLLAWTRDGVKMDGWKCTVKRLAAVPLIESD